MTFALKFALTTAACAALAGAPASAVPADLGEKAEAELARSWPADGPGVAAIVTEGGATVYAGGRGLADVEARTPVTPQTVFRLGSITKQFTAAVIVQLVAEGRLSLDDPLSRFLPDYPQPGAGATVRQLLNHTSGVQSYTGIPGWMVEANTNRAYTTEELIAVFRALPSPSQPGERWAYNNSGYVLLGAIIERVTNMPWHRAVEERIAAPLGLRTIRGGTGEGEMPLMARGYTAGPDGVRPAMLIHMSVPHAAGALIGSVEDLARWAQALHHGEVVDAAGYARMIAPTPMPSGDAAPYGFGLRLGQVRGRRAIEHAGGIFGASTESVYLPDQNLFVAVFANSDSPAGSPVLTARRLAALALGDPYPTFERATLDMAAVEPFLGVYTLPDGAGERRFFARDGKLFTQRTGGNELEAFAAGDDRYFYGAESLTWFRLERDAAGALAMLMYQNGEPEAERTLRAGPIPPEAAAVAVPRETLATYAGRYTSPIGPVTIALGDTGGLTIQVEGQPAFAMRATSPTEFAVGAVSARVVFHSEAGRVTRLVIEQGGRELPATRDAAAPGS
jgi:D-alanyl-D-alanine carboxypeptidase